jgi:hypothetical protein
MIYVPRSGQEAEKHKVGPRSSASHCMLPMHRPPWLCPSCVWLATPHPTPTGPRLASAASYPDLVPPRSARRPAAPPASATPCLTVRVRPVSPCLPSLTPGRSSPSAASCLPQPGPAPQGALAASSACLDLYPHGPAALVGPSLSWLRPALPHPAVRAGNPAQPRSAPAVPHPAAHANRPTQPRPAAPCLASPHPARSIASVARPR